MRRLAAAALTLSAASALGQEDDAVVVTATRAPQPSLEIPASVDRLYGEEIREGRPQVNLSESLGRVPGIVVQNRQNYAQDLQISSRGFGSRATFGVRGIRLIADGIPATMPDGQGQAATFALGSAERIEVLRGPFSSLYGNAAGGVIVVDTEDPPPTPMLEPSLFLGSYDTWKAGVRFGGFNVIGDLSRFETDGYRRHSAATRDHLNAKLKYGLSEETVLTVVANSLRQPDAEDPGGLSRAQMEQDPRQAVAQAFLFDTRKSVSQDQAGATVRHQLGGGSSIEASAYLGQRDVRQFLPFAGTDPTSAGGVVDLERGYGGGALRFFAGNALRFSAGLEYERMDERRRGFENLFGSAGSLKRDEDNIVTSTDLYAQGQWAFAERWSAHGGVRTSRVEFRSNDFFIVPGVNPDDSGTRKFSATTPVAGLLFRRSETVSFYGNLGRGFETPTFAELAYPNDPAATGLNLALDAARSTHAEIGAKVLAPGKGRLSAALFAVDTRDEIVVDDNIDGRTRFKNAGRTERRGIELAAETLLRGSWSARLAYTRMNAEFAETFTAGGETVPAGNLLPGVPRSQFYAQLRYRKPAWYAYAEALRRSRLAVNDANSEFADAYSVLNLVAALVQRGAGWRITEFVRIDNLTDRSYAGSVIVNAANNRYFEPAPGRNYLFGVQAALEF